MELRNLGKIGQVSALTLGGGGIGAVWGERSRDQAIATVLDAVDHGITLIDLAPSYGNGEAENVVGQAFKGDLPSGIKVTTKCQLRNVPGEEIYPRLIESLHESLSRLQLNHVDIFLLHSNIIPDRDLAENGTSLSTYTDYVIPAFEKIKTSGLISHWGITGIGWPSAINTALEEQKKPAVVQCIANLLDSGGGLDRSPEKPNPRKAIELAHNNNVGVMGIRAVQAGALTDKIDRALPNDHSEILDYAKASPFRALAKEFGISSAMLAHRYTLSMKNVDTVVLGVKNQNELQECLEAESLGRLSTEEIKAIDDCISV